MTLPATSGPKKKYEGMFMDTFLECMATSEEEARHIIKRQFIEMVRRNEEMLLIWEI